MSDEELRGGERRWRATRSLDDEVRHLAARLRVGRLCPVRLALAAECGYVPALRVLGTPPPADGATPGRRAAHALEDLLRRIARAGDDEARARAVVALAHGVLGGLGGAGTREQRDVERALDATEHWLRCPCALHLTAALRDWRAAAALDEVAALREGEGTAALLRLAARVVGAGEHHARALAHVRVAWLPWLVA